jgi:nucleoside-diphosphate-sugar epimerase
MNIAIIGSSGFIGKRLIHVLKKSGHQIFESSRYQEIGKIQVTPFTLIDFQKYEIDIVINVAGRYSRSNDDYKIIESNTGIATSISMGMKGIKKGVMNLNSYFELLPHEHRDSKLMYTHAKRFSDKILENSTRIYNLSYTKIFLFDNIDSDLSRNKLFDQLIKAVLSDQVITINNTKKNLNILCLSQILYAIDYLVTNYDEAIKQNRYDLKNSNIVSISNLIKSIEQIAQSKIQVRDLKLAEDDSDIAVLKDLDFQLNLKSFSENINQMITKLKIFNS